MLARYREVAHRLLIKNRKSIKFKINHKYDRKKMNRNNKNKNKCKKTTKIKLSTNTSLKTLAKECITNINTVNKIWVINLKFSFI